jgi:hypothetical protein
MNAPGPDPLEFCPDLKPFLRVSLEVPDAKARRGEVFVGWCGVTGDKLAAGIAMLDAQASRRGLGKAKWRLLVALKEMQRRFRAMGGEGPELLGPVLARSVIEGVGEAVPLELADGREVQP